MSPRTDIAKKRHKKAKASFEAIQRIFTVPVNENSTLVRMEQEIGSDLMGFLREHIVAGDLTPAQLEEDFQDTHIPSEPSFVSEQARFLLDKVVAQSVHTSSPSFIGHMTSAVPYFMLPLAKIMMALNQNLVKIETSKAFTPLERQVIGMLHRLMYERDDAFYKDYVHDYDRALGVFASGGTVANITALWVARNRLLAPKGEFRGVQEDGLAAGMQAHGLSRLNVLVSRRGHYSLAKACDLLGIGRRQIIPIDTTPEHKICLKSLESTGNKLRSQGQSILALVGIAGTTETGSVDDLEGMAALAKEWNCHFHVDGAWGAPTLFSKQNGHLLKGIEAADSITIDAHKQLLVPLSAGIAVFKDPNAVKSIEHQASYIIRQGSRDLGKHTLEGSRAGMAMLVHSALKIIGKKGYEILIDTGIDHARNFAGRIEADPNFQLTTPPELNILTYRFVPQDIQAQLAEAHRSGDTAKACQINELLNELTKTIQKRQRATGKTFVSRTTLNVAAEGGQDIVVFRVVMANPLTTSDILTEILKEQTQYGREECQEADFVASFQKISPS